MRRFFSSSTYRRTHFVGELRSQVDREVHVSGWLQGVRRAGKGALFGVLRDFTGAVQLQVSGPSVSLLETLPVESSLSIVGRVVKRPASAVKNVPLGDIEVAVESVPFVNPCSSLLPFSVGDASVAEDVRLRHRFLDLRSPRLQAALHARSEIVHAVRCWLRHLGFLDVETPYLFRPTPEGAREFLVKTRWPQHWYSLPQSPQQYKQLLMIGGIDRYFQIARCFRDEDMRSERQPEFTQVDLEMAFAEEKDVMAVAEVVLSAASRVVRPDDPIKFEHMLYRDAMLNYGSDKPDLRLQSSITTPLVREGERVPSDLSSMPFVKALNLTLCDVDGAELKARVASDPQLAAYANNSWVKEPAFLSESGKAALLAKFSQSRCRTALVAGGDDEMSVCSMLGKLRPVVEKLSPARRDFKKWLWVTHFPMFERQTSDGSWKAAHHPFTAPVPEDEELILSGGEGVYGTTARSYDIVLNGVELGGGSVRIHDVQLQLAALRLIGVSEQEARVTLGHLLDGLALGAPPHAGMAFGLDRLVMQLLDAPSLKDVIAFPKAADGKELMVGSPALLKD